MADVLPKPTKGSGILRFSEDVYLEFKYDVDDDVLGATFYYGESMVNLVPEENV